MSRNNKRNKKAQNSNQSDGLAQAVNSAQKERVITYPNVHIPSPADLGLEGPEPKKIPDNNDTDTQSATDEAPQIDDSVINKFDIRKLRMALVTLAEAGADMSDLVFINPSNSSPARERNRYLFIQQPYNNRLELITLVKRYARRSRFRDEGMQAFNQAVKETSASYLIEESALSWLKDKKAACWAWCYIKNQNKPFPLPPTSHFQANVSVYHPTFVDSEHMPADIPPFYSDTGIPEPELSPKGLQEVVTAFFDHWLVERHIKHGEADKLRRMWGALNQRAEMKKSPFDFLDGGNSDAIEWCWSYVTNKMLGINWYRFSATSDSDRRALLDSLYQVWECPPDTRKLFMHELRRAWSQRKFRAEQKQRKLFQAYIAPRTKEKLSQLAKERGMKMNEILERLIEDAYSLMKK
jgi:macrodomain Ter protein organizer (MatP/YcbG family)